ncbi:hypothetical protein [Agrococcus jejuensis]|uniref:Uncharacterized protein n=1 Tax=Agrococcus jejuensis TaxID=399736 RepID=A0A1G7ZY77_9MICO|nr:hypothetical protein [Agrococcus jejuensis]SDH13612.1 hypothetical protein SAMN04489720_0167 [Agrococcus jejuensis]
MRDSEKAAWRFLGFAALFVVVAVGVLVLGTALFPGQGWVPGLVGAGSVGVLVVISRRGRRDGDSVL